MTLGFGAINRSAGQDLNTGTSYHVNVRHAQALNDRWAFKVSGGVFDMDPLARPVGQVPIVDDPERGRTGGGEYPAYTNAGTTQPKFDVRVDYDHPDGRQKVIFAGGIAGTQGIMHTGIGPFDIQSGTVMGYGKVNYQRDNLRVNFFTNILDGEAPALLAIGPDGQPINFLFKNNTYDVEVGNSQLIGTKHLINYGGNFRSNTFDLSIAPGGDSRTEGGFYIQDEIFLSDHFRWIVGGRVDGFSVIDKFVFSPRTTFMIKPTPDHTIRVSYNRAFRAPSFVNSFLDEQIHRPTPLVLRCWARRPRENLRRIAKPVALDVVPTKSYAANSAWQQLNVLAHNLCRSFQLDTIAETKSISRKRTCTHLLHTIRTIRFRVIPSCNRSSFPGIGPFIFPIRADGNTDLNEESMTAYEVGYTGTLANRYTVSAAFYINDTTDNIFFTTSGVYTSANPPPRWPLPPQVLDLLAAQGIFLPSQLTYLNFEGVRDKGVELGLNTRMSQELSLFVNQP